MKTIDIEYSKLKARPDVPLSRAAVASFVFSLVIFVPIVSSVIGIFLGICGIRATIDSRMRGRRMAIAGLVFGISGAVLWGSIIAFILFVFIHSSEPRLLLKDFLNNVNSGNVEIACAECSSSITTKDVQELHSHLEKYGTYGGLQCRNISLRKTPFGAICRIGGVLKYSSGNRAFESTLWQDESNRWQICTFRIE